MVRPLVVTTNYSTTGPFGQELAARLNQFKAAEAAARKAAAITATNESRAAWNSRLNKRQQGGLGGFLGRESTGGRLGSHVKWGAAPNQNRVGLALSYLDKTAPHWIIQEIGTGSRAVVRAGGMPRPTGRPGKGATYVRSVKSQVGRRINGLVFATNGQYSPPGSRRDEQLHLASQVTGVPVRRGRRAPAIRIGREIPGQHFVKKGGTKGFREYETSLLAAAREAFRRTP